MSIGESSTKTNSRRSSLMTKATGYALVIFGVAALLVSVYYDYSILALTGLGLTLWGIILTYIRTEEYTKTEILTATVEPILDVLDRSLQELGYHGKAVYLSTKYLKYPDDNKAYIPRTEWTGSPPLEQIQSPENQTFFKNPEGVWVTPPGAGLARLFEKTLNTSFTKSNIDFLSQNLPKLLIEDLEIATYFEMNPGTIGTPSERVNDSASVSKTTHNRIGIKMKSPIYRDMYLEVMQSKANLSLGCPLTSAIACAIAKATGKLTTIEKEKLSQDNETIEIEYQTLEEQPAKT